jgi:hypothetical protein
MARAHAAYRPAAAAKPLIGASMFGVTTAAVTEARRILEERGYEVLVFHATGTGGQSLEALVAGGFLAGVLDLTTTELADELVGGVLSAGPDRLEAAGRAGLPQVVSLGALDMVNFGPGERPRAVPGPDLVPAQPDRHPDADHPRGVGRLGPDHRPQAERRYRPGRPLPPPPRHLRDRRRRRPLPRPTADDALFTALRTDLDPAIERHDLDLRSTTGLRPRHGRAPGRDDQALEEHEIIADS